MSSERINSSNHKVKKYVSFVLAFLLSLSLLAAAVLVVTNNGLFNSQALISAMDEEYYSLCYRDVTNAMSDYTIPTGIDPSVTDGIVTQDEMETDLRGYIHGVFSGNDYEPNFTLLSSRLEENVAAFFEENGQTPDGETKELIDTYVQEIEEIYTNSIRVRLAELIVKVRDRVEKYYVPALISVSALSVVLIFLCVKIHKNKHRGFRYIAYACGGTTLMTAAFPAIILLSAVYKRLFLTPQTFYMLVTGLIRSFLMRFIYAAGIGAVVTAVLIAFVYLLKNDKLKGSRT